MIWLRSEMRGHLLAAAWLGGQGGCEETNRLLAWSRQGTTELGPCGSVRWWQVVRVLIPGKTEAFPEVILVTSEKERHQKTRILNVSNWKEGVPATGMEEMPGNKFWTHQIWDASRTPKWSFQVGVSSGDITGLDIKIWEPSVLQCWLEPWNKE